jgi:DNA-binding response OmpR family regulator
MTRQIIILLIDDDLMVRQALEHVLAVENYQVVPAANRQEALQEFGKRQIDIVVIDVNPRHENGWETVQRITSLEPRVPVVGMTARAEQQEFTSSADAVDALMDKPLDVPVLIQTLNELLSQTPKSRRSGTTRLRRPRAK